MTDGNGHQPETPIPETTKKALNKASIEGAFHSADFPNALKMLVDRGYTIDDIFMRTNICSRQERLAWASVIKRCRAHNDTEGLQEAYDNLAMMVSEKGYAREQLVEAVIGENRMKAKGGFSGWFRRKAGFEEER